MLSDDYTFISRLLHRVALGSKLVAEATFDLEQSRSKIDPAGVDEHPVFVSGLARAGTTVLMQTLYSTGGFRSLTYRDMPFVLMPGMWKNLSAGFSKDMEARERAHGDSLLVDFDSAEAFEEIFWRIFYGERYIAPDCLEAHDLDNGQCAQFRRFVGAVVASADSEAQGRYLSKNNNNMLRLAGIRRAFPSASIVVPFRDPVQHALSLRTQHQNFVASQEGDKFAVDYMNWLGHHEFGLNHKPFRFGASDIALESLDPAGLDYWLAQWINAYTHVLSAAPGGAIFVCYENLCADPDGTLGNLMEQIGLDRDLASGNDIYKIREHEVPVHSEELSAKAYNAYEELRGRGI